MTNIWIPPGKSHNWNICFELYKLRIGQFKRCYINWTQFIWTKSYRDYYQSKSRVIFSPPYHAYLTYIFLLVQLSPSSDELCTSDYSTFKPRFGWQLFGRTSWGWNGSAGHEPRGLRAPRHWLNPPKWLQFLGFSFFMAFHCLINQISSKIF